MVQYYSIYDITNQRVGLFQHIASDSTITNYQGEERIDVDPNGNGQGLATWALILIIVGGILLIAGVSVVIFLKCRKRESHAEDETEGGLIN